MLNNHNHLLRIGMLSQPMLESGAGAGMRLYVSIKPGSFLLMEVGMAHHR